MVWHRCRCLVVSRCHSGILMVLLMSAHCSHLALALQREERPSCSLAKPQDTDLCCPGEVWVSAADCSARDMSCLALG